MAEVLGFITGAAGFLSLLIQVTSNIDTLRDISNHADKAPAELSSLINQLNCLECLMKEANDNAPRKDDCVLQLCHASCEHVINCLEKLKKKLPIESKSALKPKALKIFAFRHWKEDAEDLQQSIQRAMIILLMVNTRRNSNLLEQIRAGNQIQTSSPPASSPEPVILETPLLPPATASHSVDKSEVASILPRKFRRHWNCAERHCSCSCHRTARATRRFWTLEYTPLSVFRETCDNKYCNGSKYGGKFCFALSQLGIRWSAIIQFHVLTAPGKFLFRPVFEVERIVPDTSPGFEILWRCENYLITVEEACDGLVDLYRSDPTFKNHVNQSGRSYIEELVWTPWLGPASREQQYRLLELLMGELEMTRGTQSTRFLVQCAKWAGEAHQLELLETLFHFGFDATLIDSPHFQDWPEPISPDWLAYDCAPDPFFVEYQTILLKDNQGFANNTALHEAVLLGPLELVKKWIPRSDKNERNFLGQTPIHLAISNTERLLALINAHHDLDAADHYGITPLMYAAAANQEECLITLLEAGANPYLQDTRYKWNLLNYAASRRHWNLIFRYLCWLETVVEKGIAESWAQYATILYFVVYPDYLKRREVSFQQLLAKCGSVNFTFDDHRKRQNNNNLLHYVRDVRDAEVLFEHGFTLINHVNSMGAHSLMSVALNQGGPDVVRRLIHAGAEIGLKDNSQHTTLYYVLGRIRTAFEPSVWAKWDIVRLLLINGSDVLSGDRCRCPCSPNGCPPFALLEYSVWENYSSSYVPASSLEWLSIVHESRGENEAKSVILSFIRQAKFDDMEMTHVCCSRDRDQKHPLPEDDIDEILNEESEFVEILENEMTLVSAKGYETLLEEWMLQIKASLKKSCEKAIKRNEHFEEEKERHENEYSVDYKADRFITNISTYLHHKDPVEEVLLSIAQYICWMEHEYRHGSRLSLEPCSRDDWYLRRISRLHQLVSALEISTAAIIHKMRNIRMSIAKGKYRPIDVEESIKHFVSSKEIWEHRCFSRVRDIEASLQ